MGPSLSVAPIPFTMRPSLSPPPSSHWRLRDRKVVAAASPRREAPRLFGPCPTSAPRSLRTVPYAPPLAPRAPKVCLYFELT